LGIIFRVSGPSARFALFSVNFVFRVAVAFAVIAFFDADFLAEVFLGA
jgi:hypothetical protein